MFKKVSAFAFPGMASAFLLLSAVTAHAAAIDVGSSTAAMDEGRDAALALLAKFSLIGIALILSVIAGAVGIVFIRYGWKKGWKVLSGRI